MNYEELVTRIEAVIKENHRQEITGQIMQDVLTDMVGSLGRKYQFWGVASPDSAFTEGDENMVAIAFEAGTYTHFGGTILPEHHIGIFMWDGEWHIFTKEISVDAYTKAEADEKIAEAVEGKQNTLVSGTNIKTINNQSLLGSGNIDIQGGGGVSNHSQLTNLDYEHAGHTGFQPAISDLSTIRSGAQAGATALPKVESIEGKIPAQATSTNKLADKTFVNSSVQTATANFRGNWNGWDDVPTSVDDYPEDYAGSKKPTVNDYLVVRDAHLIDIERKFPQWKSDRSYTNRDFVTAYDEEYGVDAYFFCSADEATVGEFIRDEWEKVAQATDFEGNPTYLGYNAEEGFLEYQMYLTTVYDEEYGNVLATLTFNGDTLTWITEYASMEGDVIVMGGLHEGTWRFKYSGTWETKGKNGWLPEYQVSEKPLTAAQIAALDSGITEEKVGEIDGKQDALTPQQLANIADVPNKEDTSNKETTLTPTSTTKYPNSKAVADYVNSVVIATINANY